MVLKQEQQRLRINDAKYVLFDNIFSYSLDNSKTLLPLVQRPNPDRHFDRRHDCVVTLRINVKISLFYNHNFCFEGLSAILRCNCHVIKSNACTMMSPSSIH